MHQNRKIVLKGVNEAIFLRLIAHSGFKVKKMLLDLDCREFLAVLLDLECRLIIAAARFAARFRLQRISGSAARFRMQAYYCSCYILLLDLDCSEFLAVLLEFTQILIIAAARFASVYHNFIFANY